eukprot:COSAG01_NODE_24415_length_779_cov_4.551471_2_plen_101_part_00
MAGAVTPLGGCPGGVDEVDVATAPHPRQIFAGGQVRRKYGAGIGWAARHTRQLCSSVAIMSDGCWLAGFGPAGWLAAGRLACALPGWMRLPCMDAGACYL